MQILRFIQAPALQFVILFLAIHVHGEPTEPAQRLANAERRLESVRRTKESTTGPEAEVARLGTAWLMDESKWAGSLELEARTARFAELLNLAHKRELKETEQRLEVMAKPVFESWLRRTDKIFTEHQGLRAVAYRRALMAMLPPGSNLSGLGMKIETEAADWLDRERSRAKGDGETYAFNVARALLKGERIKLPASLESLTHAAGEVGITTECEKATPIIASGLGVPAVQSMQIANCSETTSDASESRSVAWTEKAMDSVDKEENYTEQELQTYTVLENQEHKVVSETQHIGSGGQVAYTEENTKTYTTPELVEKHHMVPVEHTRMIKVLQEREVHHQGSYTARVRTYSASVRVRIEIDGDGQRVMREEWVRGTANEEEFSSYHGGSSRFTGAAQGTAMTALKSEVGAFYRRVHAEWNKKRGDALLGIAKTLDQKVTSAVLSGSVAKEVEQTLQDSFGMTAEESAHLISGDGQLTPGTRPAVSSLILPPPEANIKNDLETHELVVATVDAQGGFFGGLSLGVASGEKQNGKLPTGFGGLVIMGYRPGFSVRSLLLTRLVGQLQIGRTDEMLVDGNLRGELGLQLGPLSLAGVGIVQEVGSFGGHDPLVGSAGYGGRAQLSFEVYRADFDAGPAPVALGAELVVARMHRASSVDPLGANAQATVFVDLGHIVKITLALRGTTREDLPKFLSSKTQRWFGGLGIQSDF